MRRLAVDFTDLDFQKNTLGSGFTRKSFREAPICAVLYVVREREGGRKALRDK